MKRDNVLLIIIVSLVLLSAIALNVSGFSVMSIVLLQITMAFKMFVLTSGMNIFSSLNELMKPFIFPMISLILLALAAAVVNFVDDYKKIFVASVISMIFFVLIEHTLMGFIVSFGIFTLVMLSKRTDISLLLLDVTISIGVFVVVLNNSIMYQNSFRNGMKSLIKPIVGEEVSNLQNETEHIVYGVLDYEKSNIISSVENSNVQNKDVIISDINKNFNLLVKSYQTNSTKIDVDPYIDEALDNSQMFQSTIKWFPLFISLMVFFILEFFRVIVLVPIYKLSRILIGYIINRKIKEKEN